MEQKTCEGGWNVCSLSSLAQKVYFYWWCMYVSVNDLFRKSIFLCRWKVCWRLFFSILKTQSVGFTFTSFTLLQSEQLYIITLWHYNQIISKFNFTLHSLDIQVVMLENRWRWSNPLKYMFRGSQFSVFAQEGGIAPSTLWLMATSATAALHHPQDKNFKFLFFRLPHDALFLQTVQAQNTTCSVCMLHFFISDWLFRGCRDCSSGLQQKTISQAAELPQWIIHLSHECQSGILFFSTC